MNLFRLIGLPALLVGMVAGAQPHKVTITITEGDTGSVTPAMVCITNVATGAVHLPPGGEVAGTPSYPTPFFGGITFSNNKNWVGPLRKMSGRGEVNGQRTYVYNPNPTLPYWAEPVQYQTSGDFSINCTPGVWRISVQHGMEYIPVTQTFSVPDTDTIGIVLQRWINLPRRGWWSGDVHTHHPLHTAMFRAYMLQLAKAEDVHLLNVLEMGDAQKTAFAPEGYGPAFQRCSDGYCLATGQEEPRSTYGHVIGLNGDALARDTTRYNEYNLVFDKIRRKPEALVGFAHFAYGGEGVKEGMAMYAPTGAVDFVELLQNTKMDTATYYAYLNLGFRLTAAAGSDFPWGSTVGDGRTFVYTGSAFSPERWFAGLKKGHSFVSNGPALLLTIDDALPGTTLPREKRDTLHIKLQAVSNPAIGMIDKIQLRNNDGLILAQQNLHNADSLEVILELPVRKSQWIAAAVYCKNGALAHTTPVYVVANNLPTYCKNKGPQIIANLLRVLAASREKETSNGVVQNISEAEKYYQKLLLEMQRNED